VEKINIHLAATLLAILCLGIVSQTAAQRNISYRDLVLRQQDRPAFFDFIILPGEKDDSVEFTSVFSFSYSYLPFRKSQDENPDKRFFSSANLSMEVFKAKEDQKFKKGDRNISVEGLEPVERTFWSDTAYARNYEESKSKKQYLGGHMAVSLKPGNYHYVLQMKRGDESDSRISRTQSVRIKPYSEMEMGNIIIGDKLITSDNTEQLHLNKMGDEVEYAKDFYLMAYLPDYDSNATYNLAVNSLDVAEEDTSRKEEVYTTTISTDQILTDVRPTVNSSHNETYIDLKKTKKGFNYALIKIPNSNFPNALYRVTIRKEDHAQPVSRGTFRSLWIDMPTSLYNLDVAVDMMRYIVDDKTLDRLSSGSQQDREQKFRNFWDKKDPTPNTEFNELMAEYYRRIDYAYEHFTTENVVGYNSDQGEVYIKFGPPKNIDRKFPTNGPTTEIWTYKNRQFVFKATSGFGDFRLVKDQSK
jgi:GWxTD domain-containing protein